MRHRDCRSYSNASQGVSLLLYVRAVGGPVETVRIACDSKPKEMINPVLSTYTLSLQSGKDMHQTTAHATAADRKDASRTAVENSDRAVKGR